MALNKNETKNVIIALSVIGLSWLAISFISKEVKKSDAAKEIELRGYDTWTNKKPSLGG